MVGGGWAWVPGPVVVRPVYAPALVAFVGGGGFHFSASFGGGEGVAWFPLGPGEVFVPGYHVSRTYVNQVNVTNTVVNVTKVTNVYNSYTTNDTTVVNRITYVNQRAPNAVTAVSHETFVNARPVARNVVVISQREIEQAPVSHIAHVEPIRTSVIGAGRPTRVVPPPAVAHRQVVAERPPAPPSVPFSQRRDPLVARPGQPVGQGATQSEPMRTQPNAPATRPEWQTLHPGSPATSAPVPRPEAQRPRTLRPHIRRRRQLSRPRVPTSPVPRRHERPRRRASRVRSPSGRIRWPSPRRPFTRSLLNRCSRRRTNTSAGSSGRNLQSRNQSRSLRVSPSTTNNAKCILPDVD
jgi:hypothetical protein